MTCAEGCCDTFGGCNDSMARAELAGERARQVSQGQKALNEGILEVGVADIFAEARRVLTQKHADYGPRNIADAPGGPMNGLRVRCYDKLARINHLYEQGVEPTNESLRDSWLDLMNYSAIALLCIDGNWPGVE